MSVTSLMSTLNVDRRTFDVSYVRAPASPAHCIIDGVRYCHCSVCAVHTRVVQGAVDPFDCANV